MLLRGQRPSKSFNSLKPKLIEVKTYKKLLQFINLYFRFMDSITQIVLGAAVAEKISGKTLGNKAILYGAIFGTLPDLDVLSGFFVNDVDAVGFHRGISHSIVLFLIVSPIFGWLIYKLEKQKSITFSNATSMVFWVLLTHSLLDIFTSWGVQLFWPSNIRVAIKSIAVVDFMYTLPLLICLIMAVRLPKLSKNRRKWNTWGLVISSSYLILGIALKTFAYAKFVKAAESQQLQYSEISVKPGILSLLLWSAHGQNEQEYFIGTYSFFDTQAISFEKYPKSSELNAKFQHQEVVQKLIDISEGWYIISESNHKFYFNDLRFGLISTLDNQQQFAFSYELVQQKDGKFTAKEVKKSRKQGMATLKTLLSRIAGN